MSDAAFASGDKGSAVVQSPQAKPVGEPALSAKAGQGRGGALKQIHRSLKAWRDRAEGEAEDAPAQGAAAESSASADADADTVEAPAEQTQSQKVSAKLKALSRKANDGPRIFRAPGDPKNVAELIAKLTGKALEAYNQMKELEQEPAINGMCQSARVKQADGTLNVPAAQAAFEGRWADPATFAARKLQKDQAFQKKISDALSAIKNSCDETDGKNRPNATVGDGTSEAALVEETRTGKPVVSQDGHYQKVPNYTDTINRNVTLLEAERAKITDAAKLAEVDAAITRGKERIAKMAPSIAGWGTRVATYPAVWKPDGDSKVQPGFPKVK